MDHTSISLPDGALSPFGPSVALDRAVIASPLHATPRAGEALALAASAILYFRQHRAELLAFAEIVTDLADMVDGDPDFEDATNAEDDFAVAALEMPLNEPGPGCVISDSGDLDGTEADTSWTEWHTRGRRKDDPGIGGRNGFQLHEDAEEDDAPEEDDDSGQNSEDEQSSGIYSYGWWPRGPGCPISDPGGDHDGF